MDRFCQSGVDRLSNSRMMVWGRGITCWAGGKEEGKVVYKVGMMVTD